MVVTLSLYGAELPAGAAPHCEGWRDEQSASKAAAVVNRSLTAHERLPAEALRPGAATAARYGHVGLLRRHLAGGMHPDACNEHGHGLLMMCAAAFQAILVPCQPGLTCAGDNHRRASSNAMIGVLDALLFEYGADASLQAHDGTTALTVAAAWSLTRPKHLPEEVAEAPIVALLRAGARWPQQPIEELAEDWSKLRDLVRQACSRVDLGLAQLHRDFWVAHGEGAIAAARRAVAAHERRQSLDSAMSGSLMEKVSYNASHPIPSPAAFVSPLDTCPPCPLSLSPSIVDQLCHEPRHLLPPLFPPSATGRPLLTPAHLLVRGRRGARSCLRSMRRPAWG